MANVPPPPAGHVNNEVFPNPPPPQSPHTRQAQQERKKVEGGFVLLITSTGWIPYSSIAFVEADDEFIAAQQTPWIKRGDMVFMAMSENKMIIGHAEAIVAIKTRG